MTWKHIPQIHEGKEDQYKFTGPVILTNKCAKELTQPDLKELLEKLNDVLKTTRNSIYQQIFENSETGLSVTVIDNNGIPVLEYVDLPQDDKPTSTQSLQETGSIMIQLPYEYEEITRKILFDELSREIKDMEHITLEELYSLMQS